MIDEEKLILGWMQTAQREGIDDVDITIYMALRHAIQQYNLDERAEEMSGPEHSIHSPAEGSKDV